MPSYEFECPRCGDETTRILSMSKRDEPQKCNQKLAILKDGSIHEGLNVEPLPLGRIVAIEGGASSVQIQYCDAQLKRVEIPSSIIMDSEGSYECAAILDTGEKVPGSFGKDARKRKARYSKGHG